VLNSAVQLSVFCIDAYTRQLRRIAEELNALWHLQPVQLYEEWRDAVVPRWPAAEFNTDCIRLEFQPALRYHVDAEAADNGNCQSLLGWVTRVTNVGVDWM